MGIWILGLLCVLKSLYWERMDRMQSSLSVFASFLGGVSKEYIYITAGSFMSLLYDMF